LNPDEKGFLDSSLNDLSVSIQILCYFGEKGLVDLLAFLVVGDVFGAKQVVREVKAFSVRHYLKRAEQDSFILLNKLFYIIQICKLVYFIVFGQDKVSLLKSIHVASNRDGHVARLS
jgi:hypothetical protein